ncbi:MAG: hypothetical protein EOO65_01500 [Methanosarcinales archaeon]|nr:MAG: hypothetical protein EOO65_01500 [Methanosarcinales archaeon]
MMLSPLLRMAAAGALSPSRSPATRTDVPARGGAVSTLSPLTTPPTRKPGVHADSACCRTPPVDIDTALDGLFSPVPGGMSPHHRAYALGASPSAGAGDTAMAHRPAPITKAVNRRRSMLTGATAVVSSPLQQVHTRPATSELLVAMQSEVHTSTAVDMSAVPMAQASSTAVWSVPLGAFLPAAVDAAARTDNTVTLDRAALGSALNPETARAAASIAQRRAAAALLREQQAGGHAVASTQAVMPGSSSSSTAKHAGAASGNGAKGDRWRWGLSLLSPTRNAGSTVATGTSDVARQLWTSVEEKGAAATACMRGCHASCASPTVHSRAGVATSTVATTGTRPRYATLYEELDVAAADSHAAPLASLSGAALTSCYAANSENLLQDAAAPCAAATPTPKRMRADSSGSCGRAAAGASGRPQVDTKTPAGGGVTRGSTRSLQMTLLSPVIERPAPVYNQM